MDKSEQHNKPTLKQMESHTSDPASPESLVEQIIRRIYVVQPKTKSKDVNEAMQHSLNAASLSEVEFPMNAEAGKLHMELVERRADWVTCLQAWALLLDVKAHGKKAP